MKVAVAHSGTSADAIDIARVDIVVDQSGVIDLTPEVLTSVPWPEPLRRRILDAALGAPVGIGEIARLDIDIAEAFADAVAEAACGGAELVVAPGQTVYHWVEGGRARGTLQLGRSAVIAERTGAAVISDLRAADIAAGGNGAPLMPVFDAAWLGGEARRDSAPIATLNLGGIANVSRVETDGTATGWDTGPANGLLDAVVARATAGVDAYDAAGSRAASGSVDHALLNTLLRHPYFGQLPPKSTGRETFDLAVIDDALAAIGHEVSLESLLATLVQLTARSVAESLARSGAVRTLIASGGGVYNRALMTALRDALADDGCTLVSSAERGVDPAHKESLLFALVGYFGAHGLPVTLNRNVGARVAGTITPAGWAPRVAVGRVAGLRIRERKTA
ncbi:anhydro-N-acetylmuramic acid kinase [Paramicrobacterium agarici]|uniref:Anhydro-N-acetylmuramic acid kinase n=1 Tax=Paramicrobacterium agarici TaxID=630514 RepID=A0A2A9DTI0_9MICO|nr:anhydro-N-acetylmuramic acid kinase [Microbacterium agarici]PFG29230.1 anhydro-N-acetylmuramic acid kinase [Microbacterium agarici]